MPNNIALAKENFIQGLSMISAFWGFPKAMGAIFAALYLSPQPLSMDELVEQVGVTKGAVSTNIRLLERLGMVHRQVQLGQRKDFYIPEIDFWKIVKNLLREREKNEFDRALHTVDESMQMITTWQIETSKPDANESELACFYQDRLRAMQSFFQTLDNLVAMLLTLDDFRLGALERLLNLTGREKQESKLSAKLH